MVARHAPVTIYYSFQWSRYVFENNPQVTQGICRINWSELDWTVDETDTK